MSPLSAPPTTPPAARTTAAAKSRPWPTPPRGLGRKTAYPAVASHCPGERGPNINWSAYRARGLPCTHVMSGKGPSTRLRPGGKTRPADDRQRAPPPGAAPARQRDAGRGRPPCEARPRPDQAAAACRSADALPLRKTPRPNPAPIADRSQPPYPRSASPLVSHRQQRPPRAAHLRRSARRPAGATTNASQRPSGEITGCDGTTPSTASSAVSSSAPSVTQRALPANIARDDMPGSYRLLRFCRP